MRSITVGVVRPIRVGLLGLGRSSGLSSSSVLSDVMRQPSSVCASASREDAGQDRGTGERSDIAQADGPPARPRPWGHAPNGERQEGRRAAPEARGLDLRPAAKTWETLRRHLRDSYDTPVPARTALQQLRAWVAAYAPAVTDSDVGQALALAADHDLREFDPTAVTDAWRPAWERWQRCRARASQRYRPTP